MPKCCHAQGTADVASRQGAGNAQDAVIFVRPLATNGANIGIAYSTQLSHPRVRADIKRLLNAGRWQSASAVRISDESVHPDRPKEFPATTGAFFRVTQAPQITANAPSLLPYLIAFQRFEHFQVVFEIESLPSYQGITKVSNNVLDIQMFRDEGLYTYQISVHNHKENIPALVNTGEAIDHTQVKYPAADVVDAGTTKAAEKTDKLRPHQRPNFVFIISMALTAGTLVGGSIYLVMSRQALR